MNKIPVGETISRTYGFAFSNLLSIFGIAWFPYLALAAVAAGLVFLAAPDLPRMLMRDDIDVDAIAHVGRILALLGLLSFLVGCMVTAGIQRKALGKHQGPEFFYFSLGAPVWRLVGAFFLSSLVMLLVGLLTVGVVVAIWFAAKSFAPGYDKLIGGIAIFVACLWFIYFVVRLLFFLPAVVVAEERIGLGRAWELAGGNFWRIVAVMIAVLLPTAIGFGIVSSALFGPFIDIPHFHPGMDIHELLRGIFHQMRAIGPLMILFQIVERIVFLGLGNGMIADAYLGVTGKSPDAPVAASAPG